MQRGFTLVELAIVLVIIGLLVGGGLVGQDLIKSAQINATVSDLQSYTDAAMTFRDKYGGIPGDLRADKAQAAGLTVYYWQPGSFGTGDGDGILQNGYGGPTAGATVLSGLGGENTLFWRQLSDAQLIPFVSNATGSPTNTTSWATNTGFAQAALPGLIPTLRIRQTGFVHASGLNGRNYYEIAAFGICTGNGGSSGQLPVCAALSTREALGIDQKLDDGSPVSGTVLSDSIAVLLANTNSIAPGNGGTPASANTLCYSAATLAYANNIDDALRCALRMRAGF